ncbi:hypothetical protein [Candidatus Amarobacter glycogenicus]|uniref:hypothetical protein n=1 Tax=Candidatus Amarobacter glycogenicus TaxID=3140699 RepID=UPI002A154262|nr:hypothetical protein [Dehalococcoidia bacterium]
MARQDNLTIERFEIAEPSLDDIFVRVVQEGKEARRRHARNFWLLARHEYRKLVGKRSFLVGTLGSPLILIVVMAAGIIISIRGDQEPAHWLRGRGGHYRPGGSANGERG